MDHDKLLRQFRRKPLADLDSLTALDCGQRDIERIIPHRKPFLLIDRLTGLDLAEEVISGFRTIIRDDPVFKGHFPDYPVYPGSLEQEMIGQLGLCLHYFLTKQTCIIDNSAAPVPVRATRVLGAYYLEPILPGDRVNLIAKKLEFDGFFARMIGQATVDEKICCVTIAEVCIL